MLQREGRTALSFEDLARRLGFDGVATMFVAVARDEIGPRQLEEAVRGPAAGAAAASGATLAGAGETQPLAPRRRGREAGGRGDGVLVVGIGSLMTQLARCCRPVPPDGIVGFVTRGHGVSVHREGCATFARMADQAPERVIATAWGDDALTGGDARSRRFPADVEVRASDRPGLLRDITELFARDRLNVIAVQTLSRRQEASMRFTVEVPDATQLARTLSAVRDVNGVIQARATLTGGRDGRSVASEAARRGSSGERMRSRSIGVTIRRCAAPTSAGTPCRPRRGSRCTARRSGRGSRARPRRCRGPSGGRRRP